MFEDQGIPYEEVVAKEGVPALMELLGFRKNGAGWAAPTADTRSGRDTPSKEHYPLFAPPVVQHGDLYVWQTPVQLAYIGKQVGAFPKDEDDEVRAAALSATVADLFGEIHDAYHPVNKTMSYQSQKAEAVPHIQHVVSARLPRYMSLFEAALRENDGGKGFFFGDKVTYFDYQMFHCLHAIEAQFPSWYESFEGMPTLKAFKERMQARPRIKAYLASDRRMPYAGDSCM